MVEVYVAGVRFKVKPDVQTVYREVAAILGENEDYLLAVVLALYRTRRRRVYAERVKRLLLNNATRDVVVSAARYYRRIRDVDSGAKTRASRLVRCIIDTLSGPP